MHKEKSGPSLMWRCILAALLMFLFYAFALGVAAGLIFLTYTQFKHGKRHNGRFIGICIFGVGAILWSVFPRRDKFVPPGPLLTEEDNPELFRTLRNVAKATAQEMPSEVYALADVNAFVANRGGVMGFGSRRVMGIGVPLLDVLTVPELCSVIAHEFGHYLGGDTAIAPWIFKTRTAIIRTVDGLDGSLLQLPFTGFAKVFLRITNAVSRQEEYAADATAARVTDAPTVASALRKIHSAGMPFDAFWESEVSQVLMAGYIPPITQGFREFKSRKSIAELTDKLMEEELAESNFDPYASHPALKERLAAIEKAGGIPPADNGKPDEQPAIQLLGNPDGIEEEILSGLLKMNGLESKGGIAWEDTMRLVFLPESFACAQEFVDELSGISLKDLPRLAADNKLLVKPFRKTMLKSIEKDKWPEAAASIIGCALITALDNRGIPIAGGVGEPPTVSLDGETIRPLDILPMLGTEKSLAPDRWLAICGATGISDLDLGEEVRAATARAKT